MWDEDQEYQDVAFKTTMWIAGIGTVILEGVCFLSGEISPIKNWITGILMFVGAWLIIAGITYSIVRLLGFKKAKAKESKKS